MEKGLLKSVGGKPMVTVINATKATEHISQCFVKCCKLAHDSKRLASGRRPSGPRPDPLQLAALRDGREAADVGGQHPPQGWTCPGGGGA